MFSWDTTLETGDALVDEQHRRIHRIFFDLAHAEDTPEEVMRILDRLTLHVSAHFATEEALMERVRFPRAAAEIHRLEHARLTDETRAYVVLFRQGELTTIEPLVDFLREWLVGHVHGFDRTLVDHCCARGTFAVVPDTWAAALAEQDPLAS